ncbi:hypothetical protein CR513_52098, partial [Mucuna pruriens]
MVNPFDGNQDPHLHLQTFQTQAYISWGDDTINCKLFSGTPRSCHLVVCKSPLSPLVHTHLQRTGDNPTNMEEIKARAEKHIEAEEDLVDRLQAQKEMSSSLRAKLEQLPKAYFPKLGNHKMEQAPIQFTPLKVYYPHQDDPMVISIVATDYKIERVLVDQGSSTNILYWTIFQKLGLLELSLEEYLGMLIGFVGEQEDI